MSIGKVTLVAVLIIVVGILIGMSFDDTALKIRFALGGVIMAIAWVFGAALRKITSDP